MIIIPEIETVLIMPPRTASTSIKNAVMRKYPKAFMPYRHMEACGVPFGYDRYAKVGLVRPPVARLWSIYKFCAEIPCKPSYDPLWWEEVRESTRMGFNDWILKNSVVWGSGHYASGGNRYDPRYATRHTIPENRKSQFVYLRPDLGTTVYQWGQFAHLTQRLGVWGDVEVENTSRGETMPELLPAVRDHIRRYHSWDLLATGTGV